MNRKGDASPAPGAVAAILEGQGAAVGLGDLTAEDKSNPRTAGFGSVERDKQVGRARKARPRAFNPHFKVGTAFPPAHFHAPSRFERGIHGVAQQVDEELVERVASSANRELRAGPRANRPR